MDHVLTEHGLRLTYVCDATAIDELDQDRILDDLTDDTPDGDPLPWLTRYRLADYDHLVLVTDRSSGRYLAFLAAKDGATTREEFLLLETAFVAPVARGQNLMRRMIALAVLRIGGIRCGAFGDCRLHAQSDLLPDHAGDRAALHRCPVLS